MATASDIIKIAVAEIGVKESPANSNKQKYGEEYGVNGPAWCCQFVWWVFKHSGAEALFYGGKKTAYCPTLMNFYKKQGQFITSNYKPGDIVFFDFNSNKAADHVGIVEKVSGSTVYTVEGNTGAGNDSNGGQVMRRERSTKYILGAGRPAYESEIASSSSTLTKEEKTVTITLTEIKSGSKGEQVKTAQRILNALGYPCGTVDGIFGAKTVSAVKKFQTAKKLTADGIIGANTWNRLLRG